MNSTIKICNIDNELNKRLYDRVFPDKELQPLYNPIPTSTKYCKFPINNNNITSELYNQNKVKCKSYDKFTTETVFNPGTSAPFNFYLESIDLETTLRNQHIRKDKLNENCWLPNSSNNLYKSYDPNNTFLPVGCVDPYIMHDQQFANFNPNLDDNNIGYALFNNNTRVQLHNKN